MKTDAKWRGILLRHFKVNGKKRVRNMKKRRLALLLVACITMTVAGCGNSEIKLGKYRGIEVAKVEVQKVTAEDVEEEIAYILQEKAANTTNRGAQMGDVVIIDYIGQVDGATLKGATATDAELLLGSGKFIEGFEEGIVGHQVGDTFDLNLTYPDYYLSADLAGKPVVFTVTLKGIKEVAKLTEEWVKENIDDSMTVEEYRKQVEADLQKVYEEQAKQQMAENVWNVILENSEVKKYPQDRVKEIETNLKEYYTYMAEQYGTDLKTILEANDKTLEEMAQDVIKQEYAVERIAKKEKIEVSEKEYQEALAELAEQSGYSNDTESFEEENDAEELRKNLLLNKVSDWLVEHCKQVEQ